MLFLDLARLTLQNSGIFRDSIRPHLHFDGLPLKSRRFVVSIGFRVRIKYYIKT